MIELHTLDRQIEQSAIYFCLAFCGFDLYPSVRGKMRQHPRYNLHRLLNHCSVVLGPSWKFWLFIVFTTVATLSPAAVTIIEFCDTNGQEISPFWKPAVEYIYGHRLAIVVALLIADLLLIASYGVAKLMTPINIVSAKVLLEYASHDFFSAKDLNNYHYRATLFKVRGFRRISGQWLGIITRSGETYDRSNTVFSVDRMRKTLNTGIAGECFRQGGNSLIIQVPDTDSKAYRSQGLLDQKEESSMHVKATVFFAVGIKGGDGKVWGVLVLDTNDPRSYPSTQKRKQYLNKLDTLAVAFSLLVSGGGR